MKNKDTKWLKDALKWSAEKGYKLEEAVEGYWNQVQALGTMIKGSKIVAGISGAVGAISGFLLASTDDYNTEFHTGVDVLKENPEWVLFTFASLGISLAAVYGIKKFEEWRENAQAKLEKREDQLEIHQEKTDVLVEELKNRGIYPKFRTKFNLRPQGEEATEEEEDVTAYSSNPPAEVKYKDEQTGEYLDTMASQGIRPRNRHRVNDGSVPHMPPEYSREAYREKFFPGEQVDESVTEQGVQTSTDKGTDGIDLITDYFKNNPNNQGPTQQ